MKVWETLHPFVRPDVPGCPVPLVDRALCDAAREFCTATAAWTEWADPAVADGATNRFEFDLPGQSELVRVRSVRVGTNTAYKVLSSKALPPGWENGEEGCGLDKTLVMLNLIEYLVFPKPAAGTEIVLELVLKPTITALGVGDAVVDEYAKEVAAGALATLMAQPKPWASPLATMHRDTFEAAKHTAANAGWRQRSSGEKRVRKAGL